MSDSHKLVRSGDLSIQRVGWLEHNTIPNPYMQFSPNRQWMLTYTPTDSYLWDATSLTLKQRVQWYTKGTFSGDSQHITAWMQRKITVVEVESGREVLNLVEPGPTTGPSHFPDHPSKVTIHKLEFGQRNPRLFIGLSAEYKKRRPSDDRKDFYHSSRSQCLVRNALDGTIIGEFLDSSSMALSPDTRFWARGTKQGAYIHDTETLEVVLHLAPLGVGWYQFSRDNKVISRIAGDDGKWYLIDFPTGETIATHDIPRRGPPTKPTYFTYALPDTIWAYNVEAATLTDGVTGNVVQDLSDFPPRQYPYISPSGRLLSGVSGQTLYLRDLVAGDELEFTDEQFDDLNDIMFSPEEDRLFVMPARPFEMIGSFRRKERQQFVNKILVFAIDRAAL